MNQPPDEYVRVSYQRLRAFVAAAARSVGIPPTQAARLGVMLAGNDRRGVFSHGSRQIATYTRLIQDGDINPDPEIEIVRETPVSVLLDGDGGLGYFPAEQGTEWAIEQATATGMAAMATRNHGHFGAAGLYTRRAVEEDLLAFVTSGHQLSLSPGDSIYSAAGGSPMSFCAPTAAEDPIVLDFGATTNLEYRDALAKLAPGLILRTIGLGTIYQSWGGVLAGLDIEEPRDYQTYDGAYQGSLGIFFRIDLFTEPDRFKREMDTYVRRTKELEPIEGFTARLPGGPEADRERQYDEAGIPIAPDTQDSLGVMAAELGLEPPWSE